MPDPQRSRKSPIVPVAVALVAAIALVAALVGGRSSGEDSRPDATGSTERTAPQKGHDSAADDGPLSGLARREPGDALAKGDVDAPVVMVAYSDFQCPFCGKFARDTEPVLDRKYVANGTLRIEWRDFPYLGPESDTAARAGRAAGAQGKFWEFHDAMYADQLPPNSGRLDQRYLDQIAQQIGLDVERFRADVASDAAKRLVAADFREGQTIGVTGTPSFVINGTPIVGAQPTEVFERTIEQAAEQAAAAS